MNYKKIQEQAIKEGWGIFKVGIQDAVHNMFELQRIDEDAVFESDDEAVKFVVNNALKNPNGHHAEAIKFLAKKSPNEVFSFIKSIIAPAKFEMLKKALDLKE